MLDLSQRSMATTAPHFLRLEALQPDEFAMAPRPCARRYLQTESGSFHGSLISVSLPRITIMRESWNRGLLADAAPKPGTCVVLLPLLLEGTLQFCGQAVNQRRSLLMAPECDEWECSSHGAFSHLALVVGTETLVEYGTRVHEQRIELDLTVPVVLEPASDSVVRRLQNVVERALLRFASEPALVRQSAYVQGAQELVFQRLFDAISESRGRRRLSTSSRRNAFRRATEFIRLHARQPLAIEDVCKSAQVSARTLQYAFRDFVGTTPQRYLKLYRLNGARRALIDADPATDTVSAIASAWGFDDFGHFAADYRRTFGELPSADLRAR